MVPAGTPGYEQLVDTIQREQGFGRRRGAHGQYTRIEIGRIRAGADVRTTVSLPFKHDTIRTDLDEGHASQHSQPRHSGTVEGDRRQDKPW